MDLDFSQMMRSANDYVTFVVKIVVAYYDSLDQMEYIGWGVAALGLVLVILGLIL
jgi:hypothetical protein